MSEETAQHAGIVGGPQSKAGEAWSVQCAECGRTVVFLVLQPATGLGILKRHRARFRWCRASGDLTFVYDVKAAQETTLVAVLERVASEATAAIFAQALAARSTKDEG